MASMDAFYAETQPSETVTAILKESCLDCHSNNTRYPWYSNITPVNYWLNDHVVEGKEHFNVSDWDTYTVKKKDHKLEELVEMVESKEMPLDSYTWTHREANLSDAQITAVIDWANKVRSSYNLESQAD